MNPAEPTPHEKAVDALIAASLSINDSDEIRSEDEISRYVDQRVTLSAEDQAALEATKTSLFEKIDEVFGTKKVTSFSAAQTAKKSPNSHPGSSGPPEEFIQAVVIAELTRRLYAPGFPLGRFRYNKFAYFARRKADEEVAGVFLKKAAGPYSPWSRYQGPESIALKNGYIQRVKSAKGEALIPGSNIDDIEKYLDRYPVCRSIGWTVETFRFVTNERLELLATVDLAALDIKQTGGAITEVTVRTVIATSREWAPKLERPIFSDQNIRQALEKLQALFPGTYSF